MESCIALKCQVCGKELDMPFQCSYCQAYFCNEHRLPESHQCSNQPKEPLPYISLIAPEDKTPRVGLCPKCHFAQSDMTDYDAETMTFKCRRCGFKYSQLKASPHDYIEPKDKTESKKKPKTRSSFPIKKIIGLALVLIVIGALLWYAPTIISYFQTPTNSSDESSYTEMTLRDLPLTEVNATIIEFGDTDYSFRYSMGYLMVFAPFQSKQYIPTEGKTYSDLGIEIKVSKVGSDYISNYVVILVKPTVQNYMTSLHYTKVKIALYETKAVNISSGLINKTNQYWFTYTQVTHPTFSEPKLTIRTASQSKEYYVIGGFTIREFEIETRVYKIESGYMVIYVKPLY